MARTISRATNSFDSPSFVGQEKPVMMARRHDKREQFIPFVSEMEKGILYDFSLRPVFEMTNRRLVVEQIVDERQK